MKTFRQLVVENSYITEAKSAFSRSDFKKLHNFIEKAKDELHNYNTYDWVGDNAEAEELNQKEEKALKK